MNNFDERIGFTATHGLEFAKRGPFFVWSNGKCNNALTVHSWWHQNFIMEITYEKGCTGGDA